MSFFKGTVIVSPYIADYTGSLGKELDGRRTIVRITAYSFLKIGQSPVAGILRVCVRNAAATVREVTSCICEGKMPGISKDCALDSLYEYFLRS
jgi:hypothetical protein